VSDAAVLVRDEGPVRWLTLNRPAQRNALGGELVDALEGALEDARESRARCVALTGAGTTFSAGADLKALEAMRDAPYAVNLADSQRLANLFAVIASHPLPVVAAVNGHAIGGGAGLAVACDLTIAAAGATFGFSEVRIGFIPAIVLNFLLRTAGEKVARDLCLTGRRLPVEEAAALGLMNGVVPHADLPGAVAAIGAEIARCGPHAVAETKQLFLRLRHLPLDEGLAAAAEENARARGTDECREGIAAFLEKRNPNWIEES